MEKQIDYISEIDRMTGEIANLRRQQKVLDNCGMGREARKLESSIRTLYVGIAEYRKRQNKLDDELCEKMITMLMHCDLAYAAAIEFKEAYEKTSNSAKPLTDMVDDLVRKGHDIVSVIDELDMPRLSEHYAEMTGVLDEECAKVVPKIVNEVYNKFIRLV